MTLPRLVSENRNESDGDDGLLHRQPPAIRQMGLRCTVALALLMVLASADFYVLWSQARLLKSDALVVNVSGRQRLRMSRIGVLILRMLGAQDARERLQLHNELRGAIERFADTHNQLMQGNERLGLPAPPANVRKVLAQQPYEFDRRAREYIVVVGALAEVPEAELSLIHPAVLRYRDLAIDSKLLDGVEAFVTAWQVENEARVNSLQFTGYVCLLATFAALALTGTVVFAPMVRQVRREATELQAVNARLNSQTQQLHREIEERIQTLSALRQSEEQFRALFESAGAGMAQTDPNSGRFLRVNAKFCEITGYSRDELRDMSFLHLAHPDHRDAEGSALLQLQRTPEARYAVESRYLRKGGHVIHAQVNATLVRDAAGHPQSIVAVMQDITARKLAEAALSDSEERLRAVVDAAADAIITIDDRGTVVTFNRAAVKIFGCSQEQIIGNSSRLLLPEWSLEDAAGSETQLEPSGEPYLSQSREIVGRRHDGSLFPAELSSSELKVGPWRMWTWIVRDITDRKRTAEALRSSQERMRLVLQSAMDVVITMNDRGLITGWNPQAEQTFGWTADEALGQSLSDLIIPPDSRSAHRDGLRRFLTTGVGPILNTRLELTALRRNGEVFPVELSISPIRLADGYEFSGFLRDITERKRAEQALQSLNETLESRVTARTAYVKLLQHVAVIANQAESVDEAFRSALDLITRFMHWPVGHAYVPDPEEPATFIDSDLWSLPSGAEFQALRRVTERVRFAAHVGTIGRVLASGRPVWIADVSQDKTFVRAQDWQPAGIKASLAFPVLAGHETVAVLEFFSREAVEPDDELLEVMIHVGTQLGRVVERRRLQEQLVDAVWRQQRSLGQELHDSVGQELTGIGMMSTSLAQKLRTKGLVEAVQALELTEHIRQALARVRALSRGLFPVEVDADGLMAALTELTGTVQQQHEIACVFACDQPVRVHDNEVATHLFRITQEAVHNAVKHAHARRIDVRLTVDGDRLALQISDDGRGLNAATNGHPGMGLRIMRYRADVIGAVLSIGPNDTGGTVVRCVLEKKQRSETCDNDLALETATVAHTHR